MSSAEAARDLGIAPSAKKVIKKKALGTPSATKQLQPPRHISGDDDGGEFVADDAPAKPKRKERETDGDSTVKKVKKMKESRAVRAFLLPFLL